MSDEPSLLEQIESAPDPDRAAMLSRAVLAIYEARGVQL